MLCEENWDRCSAQAVVQAFLRAEWDKWPQLHMTGDRGIVDHGDQDDLEQNNLRSSLLWAVRGPLLQWVPTDTVWFRVQFLRAVHFAQLRVIFCEGWAYPEESNELERVAARKSLELRGAISDWDAPVLWGHDSDGPFTILEGNNRLTALAGSAANRQECAIEVYVGLSQQLCRWHFPDVKALNLRRLAE